VGERRCSPCLSQSTALEVGEWSAALDPWKIPVERAVALTEISMWNFVVACRHFRGTISTFRVDDTFVTITGTHLQDHTSSQPGRPHPHFHRREDLKFQILCTLKILSRYHIFAMLENVLQI
jgi:hypothetical protein